jgi:hypothetical protein
MATKFVYLQGEDREFLTDLCQGMYLDGSCYIFALAMHRALGWPIIGLMEGRTIRHALVRHPGGKLWDVRGPVPEEMAVAPFGLATYDFSEVAEAELVTLCHGEEHVEYKVEMAERMAQSLWPNLPWKSSQKERLQEFADGLEELSRRTGVWIRSPVPGCPPVLAPGLGDEGGYRLSQMPVPQGYTIDRYFPALM